MSALPPNRPVVVIALSRQDEHRVKSCVDRGESGMDRSRLRRRGGAGRAPTISDVAARAGVSVMTVSRVINGEDKVRPATRDAVDIAIAALNYAPNRAAQSLAGAGQIRIALLYSNPSAAYLSEFLVGGLDQASRGAVQLVVEKCEPDDHEADVARRLVASGIDGFVLPPPLCDNRAVLAALVDSGTPVVAVATGRVAARVSAVSIDDRRAAFEMTMHIAALGHTRIGFIAGHPNQTGRNGHQGNQGESVGQVPTLTSVV